MPSVSLLNDQFSHDFQYVLALTRYEFNPRGSITDHTKPSLILWNQPRLFALLEGRTKLCLVLHLVPAQEMDYALLIDEIKPKALGISPLAVPRGASGPRVTQPRLALPSAFGTRGHI